jgi:hypothetical protein
LTGDEPNYILGLSGSHNERELQYMALLRNEMLELTREITLGLGRGSSVLAYYLFTRDRDVYAAYLRLLIFIRLS